MVEKDFNKEVVATKRQQMRKGVLSYAVLLSLQKGEAYASHVLADLKNADLLVVEGTLYPLLNRLKSEGALNYKWRESKNGPPRKYYSLTSMGKNTLQELQKAWEGLQKSIINISK